MGLFFWPLFFYPESCISIFHILGLPVCSPNPAGALLEELLSRTKHKEQMSCPFTLQRGKLLHPHQGSDSSSSQLCSPSNRVWTSDFENPAVPNIVMQLGGSTFPPGVWQSPLQTDMQISCRDPLTLHRNAVNYMVEHGNYLTVGQQLCTIVWAQDV